MLLYGAGLVFSIAAALHNGESPSSVLISEGSPLTAWFNAEGYPWFALMAAGFGVLLSFEWMTGPHRVASVYGSGHAHSFEFAADEAMKALQLSLAIAQRPGDTLKQLYSTEGSPKYAVKPQRPKFWDGIWSDFKSTTLYRLFEASVFATSFEQLRNASLAEKLVFIFSAILLVATAVPALLVLFDSYIALHHFENGRPPLANFIVSFRSANKTISNITGSALFAIAGLCLIGIILWRLLLIAGKAVRLGLAWVTQLLLQGPGARVMGLVVRNAAFGGQCRQVLAPRLLPEHERACSEAISDELSKRMSDLSARTAAQAGEALYFALAEGDALLIKRHILSRLTDPQLVHCQYYREDEVIGRIAELISVPASQS
ncbi:hypothetical protein XH87_07690 [Bradyrhizobium sp. CCBAU 53415]|nr:hypothetical protein [Bradyrhizobium sp. CCBAU 53415]